MTLPAHPWRLATYLVLAGLAVAAVVVVARQSSTRASARTVAALLGEADELIGIGAVSPAMDSVAAAATAARTERDHLRVLDRAYSISRVARNWSQFDALARAAHTAISGSSVLRRVAAYASLRAGDPAYALAIIGTTPREGATLAQQLLLAEALVASGATAGDTPAAAALDPDLSDLVTARDTKDPELMLQVGLRSSPDLILDAALLFAGQGALARASSLFESHLDAADYDLPAFFVAYDSGNLVSAERRLSRYRARSGDAGLTLQLAGDLALQRRRLADAADLYRKTIALAADFSWHAYLNLARILSDADDQLAAFDVLESALVEFRGVPEIAVAMTRLYVAARRSADAELLAARLRQIEAPGLEIELALLDLTAPVVGAASVANQLARLAEENPQHGQLQRVLVTRLVSVNDLDGAELALRNFSRTAMAGVALPAWWHELSGVVAARRGRLVDALAALRVAAESDVESWAAPFNLAVVLLTVGRDDAVRVALAEADTRLRSFANRDAARGMSTKSASARIHTRLGELNLLAGDLVAARREFNFASELDPGYVRARVLSDRLVDRERN